MKKVVCSERLTKEGTKPVAALRTGDSYHKSLSFVNKRHIVYMTDSSEEIDKLSKICNVKVVELAPLPEGFNKENFQIFSYEDGIFIRTVFALFGLKLLADEQAITYMDELYSAYEACYEKLHTGKPIMRKTLADKMSQSPYNFKYYRPHCKDKPNKYAVKGLSVDKEKLEALVNSTLSDSDEKANEFYNYLGQEIGAVVDFLNTTH